MQQVLEMVWCTFLHTLYPDCTEDKGVMIVLVLLAFPPRVSNS